MEKNEFGGVWLKPVEEAKQIPLRWSHPIAQACQINSKETVALWITLRTITNPETAIDFHDLYNMYIEDFEDHAIDQFFLGRDEMLDLIKDMVSVIDGVEVEQTLITGFDWATLEDMERSANEAGIVLERVPDDSPSGGRIDSISDAFDAVEPEKTPNPDPRSLDPDGKYRAWLHESLVIDEDCFIGYGDVFLAFESVFATDGDTMPLSWKQIIRLVAFCFPVAKFVNTKEQQNIENVRWAKLPERVTSSHSVTCLKKGFPQGVQEEGHRLLYLKKNMRVRALLAIFFEEDPNTTISLRSLWRFYCLTFSRAADTHVIVDENTFSKLLLEIFDTVEEVVVGENHHVMLGLAVRHPPLPAREFLRIKREEDFRFLPNVDPSDPRNQFNQGLMVNPVLAQRIRRPRRKDGAPRSADDPETAESNEDDQNQPPPQSQRQAGRKVKVNSKVDANAAPGPFIQRLRRRAHDPPLPLGDEEPGFPGISMKAESRRSKKRFEKVKEASMKLLESDPSFIDEFLKANSANSKKRA